MTACYKGKTKDIFKSSFLYLFFLLSIASCKKNTDTVGDDIAARNTFNSYFDTTIEVRAYSVQMDSFDTHKLSYQVLGKLNDPALGLSSATIITQVGLPTNEFSWGGATKLDSLVFMLRYATDKSYYGDLNSTHTLKVYELNEDLKYDSLYYCNRPFKTNAVEIGTWTGKFNLTDSINLKFGSKTSITPAHIRIKLTDAFKSKFYVAQQNGDFISFDKFKTAFKGFVIVDESTPVSSQGSFVYINTNSDFTGLFAYYSDSLFTPFLITQNSEARYNYYSQASKPNGFLQKPLQGEHRDTGFVQALFGTKLRIEIPDFSKFLDKKLAINAAEMVLSVMDGSDQANFSVPEKLTLVASDSNGRNTFSADQVFESGAYIGGTYIPAYKQYRFNIARQIQYWINQYNIGKNENYGLNLIVRADDPVTAARVLLNTNSKQGKIRLKLTYTIVN